jgi:predicted N-formylglutamate amidohydrolase
LEQPDPKKAAVVLRPASISPLLLTCEHASSRLPVGIRVSRRERRILDSHHGIDIGAWGLTREIASRLSATALGGRLSRLWIDLNRHPGDPELIRQQVDGADLGWNRSLGRRDRESRIRNVHDRYHAEIDQQIRRRLTHGVSPVLLSIHSFTNSFNGRSRNFDCGVLYDRDGGHARILAAGLREERLTVRYNAPYSGKLGMMYAAQRHGAAYRLPCLELEVNQNRIDDREKVAALAPAVTRAVRPLFES